MSDGVLVLDHGGRLVDINPAAARMAGIELIQGQAPSGLPAPIAAVLAAADGESQSEVTLPVAGRSRVVELRVSPFGAPRGRPLGRLVILRDITERRAAEQERERLFADLQSAVAEIRTLRGLLPICSSCKRVRDDSGYWNQIETYISAHADVRFSHGLCPDCARRLYPEVFGKPVQPGPEAG
jgi:nitrogen fixation/metabolism regulation signal transduction histidine kinase